MACGEGTSGTGPRQAARGALHPGRRPGGRDLAQRVRAPVLDHADGQRARLVNALAPIVTSPDGLPSQPSTIRSSSWRRPVNRWRRTPTPTRAPHHHDRAEDCGAPRRRSSLFQRLTCRHRRYRAEQADAVRRQPRPAPLDQDPDPAPRRHGDRSDGRPRGHREARCRELLHPPGREHAQRQRGGRRARRHRLPRTRSRFSRCSWPDLRWRRAARPFREPVSDQHRHPPVSQPAPDSASSSTVQTIALVQPGGTAPTPTAARRRWTATCRPGERSLRIGRARSAGWPSRLPRSTRPGPAATAPQEPREALMIAATERSSSVVTLNCRSQDAVPSRRPSPRRRCPSSPGGRWPFRRSSPSSHPRTGWRPVH